MTVKAAQIYVLEGEGKRGDLLCLSCFNSRAELGVHLTRSNRSIGMWVNSRGNTKHNFLSNSVSCRNLVNSKKLLGIIYYKVTDAVLYSKIDVGICFVVRVKICIFEGEACAKGGVNLTAGNYVDTKSLFLYNSVKLLK